MENRLLKRIYNNNLPQAKQMPTKWYIRHICDFVATCWILQIYRIGTARTPRENIPYICDFSRGGLNARLCAYIQTLFWGHRYRVYFLWWFYLFQFGKYAVVCSLPNELNSNLSLDKSWKMNIIDTAQKSLILNNSILNGLILNNLYKGIRR